MIENKKVFHNIADCLFHTPKDCMLKHNWKGSVGIRGVDCLLKLSLSEHFGISDCGCYNDIHKLQDLGCVLAIVSKKEEGGWWGGQH